MSAFRAIAVDYDGTLTCGGPPRPSTLDALTDARRHGLHIVLVTGRILAELRAESPDIDTYVDVVVAENGAVVARGTCVELLASAVEESVMEALTLQEIPYRLGEVILASQIEQREAIAATLQRLGVDHQLMINRSELMVVPAGVTKATGLRAGLAQLGISCHNTLALGDAENDHALLQACELGVAVANAVDALKQRADVITTLPDGDGVSELLAGPLPSGELRLHPARWQLLAGDGADGAPVTIPSSQVNILVSGPSGSGKSHAAGMLAEQLIHLGYSLLVIDPQGDYEWLATLPTVLACGGRHRIPDAGQIVSMLRQNGSSVVVDLSLRPRAEVELFSRQLPPLVEASRAATGIPQWILIDEAHDPLGERATSVRFFTPDHLGYLVVTYHPDQLAPVVRDSFDIELRLHSGQLGRATLRRRGDPVAERVQLTPRATHHIRHWHKYRATPLPANRGFWFRPDDHELTGAVATSLAEFHHVIARAPQAVLRHHAEGGDFSRWIDDVFRDHHLAHDIRAIEDQIVAVTSTAEIELFRHDLLATLQHRLLGMRDASCDGPGSPVERGAVV
jgi:hydroxymethylpyrimidine pyrophosphatase-like HAD family hydrolase